MVSKATAAARLALGKNWMDTTDAAREIGTTPKALSTTIGPMLTRQSRSLAGRGARGVGYAYARHDLERVNAIKMALGCNTVEAARILHGIRVLGHNGMLATIEKQLVISLEAERAAKRPKRRKQ